MTRNLTRSLPLLVASCAVVLSGCITFPIGVEISEQSVTGDPLAAASGMEVPLELDFDGSMQLDESVDLAKNVRVLDLSLRITDTARDADDTDNFDFVSGVTVYVRPESEQSDLPEVIVATSLAPEEDGQLLPFEVDSEVDLTPYLEEGMRVRTEAIGTVPEDDVTFDGELLLGVVIF